MPVTGPLSKPKKPLPAKALSGKGGKMRGVDNTPLRAYDPNPTTSAIVPRTTTSGAQDVGGTSYTGGAATGGSGAGSGNGAGDSLSGAMPGGYTPLGYGELRWSQPEALAQDFLSGLGITNPEMIGIVGDIVNSLPALQLIMSGDPNMDAQAQFDTNYLTQMTTPGGSALDVASLMEALATADPNSAAGMFMMNPETSSQDIVGLAMQLLNASGANPYYQRGYQGLMESNLRNYEIDKAKGAQGFAASPFYQSALNAYGG